MSGSMQGLPIRQLLQWAVDEYGHNRSVFGIPVEKFYRPQGQRRTRIFGQDTAMPLGPAAGPHTQLAQNIAAAYLCGSRYFELKTVQILDSLEIAKPCINAQDEGYNTEWSTELSIQDARDEYVKAWFLLHFLADLLQLSAEPDFIFNMSVGYDLAGIQSEKVDSFIVGLKNAAHLPVFMECRQAVADMAVQLGSDACCRQISPQICSSITLSTMHGCPPAEIEAISRYLLAEKGLHLYVKMNPTLLGYSWVKQTLDQLGYGYLRLKEDSFQHDIGYSDAVAMLRRLQRFAADLDLEFGVKLSNTLPAGIDKGELPGEEMYMSGRSLYPLTANLAHRLAAEFSGQLPISFSGGCDGLNAAPLLAAGIMPLTMATTLLKPGGYGRLSQAAASLDGLPVGEGSGLVNVDALEKLAAEARRNERYAKDHRPVASRKLSPKLPLTDCFIAPCQSACPIGQDIPEYIRLVGEERYTDAYRLITAKNPLPMITGEICPHPCTGKCTRLDYDTPVCIRELKKVAAVHGGAVPFSPAVAQRDHGVPVAVIGAGPAGLSAAYFLAGAGFKVTVIDREKEAGGTVSRVIPDFRVSPEAVAHDLDLVRSRGVQFRLGADPAFSLADLRREGFKYICLALGAGESTSLTLAGQGDKILPAVPFLAAWKADPRSLDLGKNVVVVGGGNSAMDAARAAKRLPGVEAVTVVYRRSRAQMPAHREEIEAVLAEGIGLLELYQPVSLSSDRLTCQEMFLTAPGKDGRPQPQPMEGHFREIPADTVISAVGERLAGEILRQNGIQFTADGLPAYDPETLETSQRDVFIAGDALSGPATIVEAIAGGKQVASAICAREGVAMNNDGDEHTALGQNDPADKAAIQLKKGILREGCLAERAEAGRCLECSRLCNICAEVCPNRANIAVRTGSGGLRDISQIVHLDALCNECGNCGTFCPYDGAPYRDKLTLFAGELDFTAGGNSGFYLAAGTDRPEFVVRHQDRLFRLVVEDDGRMTVVQSVDEGITAVISALWQQHRYLFHPDA